MMFQERETETGFTYTVEDVFGTIVITSAEKLVSHSLDLITSGILASQAISGSITDTISFTFEKADQWLPEEKPIEPLKKGQCPNCRGFKAYPLPMLTFVVGLLCVALSPLAFILFLPIGILALGFGLIAATIGPIAAAIMKPGHVYCMECKQTS